MCSHCCRPHQLHPQFLRQHSRLYIQVVENFQVIRNEPKRGNQNVRHTFAVQFTQVIENIRAKPRLAWRSAPALKDQIPTVEPHRLGNQPRRFPQLLFVIAGLGHRPWNAMSGNYQTKWIGFVSQKRP